MEDSFIDGYYIGAIMALSVLERDLSRAMIKPSVIEEEQRFVAGMCITINARITEIKARNERRLSKTTT